MKSLPLYFSLASLPAFALFPFPAIAGAACFALSIAAFFVADYGRSRRRWAPTARVIEFPRETRGAKTCDLAA